MAGEGWDQYSNVNEWASNAPEQDDWAQSNDVFQWFTDDDINACAQYVQGETVWQEPVPNEWAAQVCDNLGNETIARHDSAPYSDPVCEAPQDVEGEHLESFAAAMNEWMPFTVGFNEVTGDDASSSNSTRRGRRRARFACALKLMEEAIRKALHDISTSEQCNTYELTGSQWMLNRINGSRDRFYNAFRMEKAVFHDLCSILVNVYGLPPHRNFGVEVQVGMFLWMVGHNEPSRDTQERFNLSTGTISKVFHEVLAALTLMSQDWVKPTDTQRSHMVLDGNRMYLPFKGCIGAIDGTHIKVKVPRAEQPRWIGRKGYPTQNILATCDLEMCFIFTMPGWEGSAHDTRIFMDTLRSRTANFPIPQGDEFYLVDSGYPNMKGYLAPCKGSRYHLEEFQQGQVLANPEEKFNKVHASIRSVIERSFGVWKGKWKMVKDIPSGYDMVTQVQLVCATMTLHNFIRRSQIVDKAFEAPYDPAFAQASSRARPISEHILGCDDAEME